MCYEVHHIFNHKEDVRNYYRNGFSPRFSLNILFTTPCLVQITKTESQKQYVLKGY